MSTEAPVEDTPLTQESVSYFSTVDYAIFVILLTASLLLGTLAGWKSSKSDTRDFLTGSRTMNPAPVVLSLLGGVVSALSVLGNATEMYLYGTQLWLNLLGCVWGSLIVIFLLLPVIYPLGLETMNHYLEMRFNSLLLRKLGSLTQFANSALYLGVCLYAPSLTLSSVTNMSTWTSIVVLGIICSAYISLGGVRAVVYTDVLQTTVMFIGVLAVIIQVCIDLGGVGEVWSRAEEGGRLEFFNFDTDPLVRHTFWSVQVLGTYFIVSVIGISQPQYQRLVSVRSLRTSQGLCVAFLIGLFFLWSLFYFSGLVAYAAYQDCDPLSTGRIEKSDQVLAFLVADKLHHLPGMTGIFVAAVAGAVLSSLSSQANAMVVLLWGDFLEGWWIFADVSQTTAKNITRILSSCMGLLGIGLAFLVANLGTLFQVAYSISGALVSPLDGLFLTAIVAPWVNTKGAIAGFTSALSFNLFLIIGKFVTGAGTSEKLPLSTECPDGVFVGEALNGTSAFVNGTDYVTMATTTVASSSNFTEERDYLRVYDISYCYLGSIGILIVLIVSTLVSLITGVTKPEDLDDNLVDKRCLAAYKWLWGGSRFRSYDIQDATQQKSGIGNEGADLKDDLNHSQGTQVEMKVVK